MEFSIKFDTAKSRWPIIYFEGSQVMIHFFVFLSLKIDLVLANIVDPGEMSHATFHLGPHCLLKYRFWGFLREVLECVSYY